MSDRRFSSAIPEASRRAVAERHGVQPGGRTTIQCAYCGTESIATWPLRRDGRPGGWVHFGYGFGLDHVIPRFSGGSDDPENLVIACRGCNSAKQHRPLAEFTERLRRNSRGALESDRSRSIGKGRGREEEGNGGEFPRYRSSSSLRSLTREGQ